MVEVDKYELQCEVEVDVRLEVPSPLTMVPGPLLGTTFKLVTRIVMLAVRTTSSMRAVMMSSIWSSVG